MSVTQRGVKPSQSGSNSPEFTHGSSPARPETAETLGFRPTATKSKAEAIYGTRRLVRIEWCEREELGWSELAGVELVAAAGVRAEREKGVRCTAGLGSVCVRLLGLH